MSSEVTTGTETKGNNPFLECDLVMKGGITSGIVYPKAVLALKDTYRFCNIGGTSAGAIAAAASAAAEYGREARDAAGKDGFDRLGALNDKLCEQSFLRDLFQPSPKTAALMNVASAAMMSKTSRFAVVRVVQKILWMTRALFRNTAAELGLGALAGIGVGWGLSALDGGTATGVRRKIFLGLYGILGALVGPGWALLRKLFFDLPNNGFGICIGHNPKAKGSIPDEGKPVLIDWLIGQIEGIGAKNEWATVEKGLSGAGRKYKMPLTFGDLQSRSNPIVLKMMTTNISEELPYVLPFENNRFLFEESKMREYFPRDVVDHLVGKRHRSGRGLQPPPGFFFLPDANDLPIVVAMRMSLSFPILLSAVPLWTLGATAFTKINRKHAEALTKDDLNENWFSDGGLSSNFPIHFFDSWLPTRPTFGINLTAYPPEAFVKNGQDVPQTSVQGEMMQAAMFSAPPTPGESEGRNKKRQVGDPAAAVYLPRASENTPKIVNALPTLVSFLGAIVSVMQNYRDNQQSQLPSYRERIIQVRLKKTEGGLNLDMPSETLRGIAEKGKMAGEGLLSDFDLDEHQWTRFRVVMGQLEAELREMQDRLVVKPPAEQAKFDAGRLLGEQQRKGFPYGYRSSGDLHWDVKTDQWVGQVKKVLGDIDGLMRDWPQPPASGGTPLFARNSPKPASNLRLMPQLYAPLSDGDAASDATQTGTPVFPDNPAHVQD